MPGGERSDIERLRRQLMSFREAAATARYITQLEERALRAERERDEARAAARDFAAVLDRYSEMDDGESFARTVLLRHPKFDPELPVMALRRRGDGTMDEVVIENVQIFRAEQLDGGLLWLCCYFANGERVTFQVNARSEGLLVYDVIEMPAAWIDRDDRKRDRGS